MEVLLSGLNSYLGKRAMSNLSREDFNVHGISLNPECLRH